MEAYCNRPWPQLELYIPVNVAAGKKMYRFYDQFLRSFLLFWPTERSNTSLNIVIDEEAFHHPANKLLHQHMRTVQSRIPGGWKVTATPPKPYYNDSGYDRQQYEMFYADLHTDAEYVGFIDDDGVLLTYVDREDLFEDGKPVVNGKAGYDTYLGGIYDQRVKGDFRFTHIKEPMSCMSYFPVIIKTSHFRDMRDFISSQHNMSFDELFQAKLPRRFYSQFAIFCSYLFAHKRDEYRWYVHGLGDWDGVHPPPFKGQSGDVAQFTPQMRQPKPRIATHASYRSPQQLAIAQRRDHMNTVLQLGVCLGPQDATSTLWRDMCSSNRNAQVRSVQQLGYYDEMFNFEAFDYAQPKYNRHDALVKQHQLRQRRVESCTHRWDPAELQQLSRHVQR